MLSSDLNSTFLQAMFRNQAQKPTWCRHQVLLAQAPLGAWQCLSWDLQHLNPNSRNSWPCLPAFGSHQSSWFAQLAPTGLVPCWCRQGGCFALGLWLDVGSCNTTHTRTVPIFGGCSVWASCCSKAWSLPRNCICFVKQIQVWGPYGSREHPVQLFVCLCCWWHSPSWPTPPWCDASGKGSNKRGSSDALKAKLKQHYWSY